MYTTRSTHVSQTMCERSLLVVHACGCSPGLLLLVRFFLDNRRTGTATLLSSRRSKLSGDTWSTSGWSSASMSASSVAKETNSESKCQTCPHTFMGDSQPERCYVRTSICKHAKDGVGTRISCSGVQEAPLLTGTLCVCSITSPR